MRGTVRLGSRASSLQSAVASNPTTEPNASFGDVVGPVESTTPLASGGSGLGGVE